MSSSEAHRWALIGDSSLLEYAARGRCDLQVLRGPQTNRYLSLASPVGCVYRDRLSLTVLQLLERGRDGASHRELFLRGVHVASCSTVSVSVAVESYAC